MAMSTTQALEVEAQMTSWQICPLCKAKGQRVVPYSYGMELCPVCEGHRIISTFAGKPPAGRSGLAREKDELQAAMMENIKNAAQRDA